ncbi:MAG: V-type ATP synthase subunit I [Otoolea sp.]|nr:ATPase [Clostridiaceae bacterium]MDD6074246.1 V-type ATPase 116kDa subunit family protein [Clostridium sp.]MDY5483953.1 V-type ATPase 116kDa subunit family protein [Clostridium sp.]
MIEQMRFISISGPKDDLDRMVNQVLSHYEIQLENALTELKSVYKLVPFPGNNPYRSPLEKVKKLTDGVWKQEKRIPSMTADSAVSLVEETSRLLEESEREKEELRNRIRDIHAQYEQFKLYTELDFNLPALMKFRHIKYRFGRVLKKQYEQLEHFAESSEDTILYKCHETEHYVSLIYFVPEVVSDRIDAVFSSLQFERIFLPDEYNGTPQETADRLEREMNERKAQLEALEKKETLSLQERMDSLCRARDVLEAYHSNFDVRRFAALTHEKDHPYYILCGWMTAEEAEKLKEELKNDRDTFFSLKGGEEHAVGLPPTKLKNPAILRPFEMFVKMYGLPAYNEFDPTLLIAVTYSVFFGFMFGDAGQGLLLFVGGLLLYKTKKMDLAAILSCCGISSTVFGLLFGSVFGFENVIPALWLKPTEAMTRLPFVGRLNTVFVVAIALGMGMILLTMLLNMAAGFKNHDTEKTWFDTNGMAGFVFYASLAAVIVLYMTGKALPATVILTVMFVVPLGLIFLKEPLTALVEKKSEKISGSLGMFFVQGFFELFEVLLSYFSNTLSFVRVGAFAVSHAAMMQVVLMLSGAENGHISIPVIVLGNLFVCGMEGLVVGIQVLRLEYYELFSRFYKGTGREFRPFCEK